MRKPLLVTAVVVLFVTLFAAASPAGLVTGANDAKLDPALQAKLATLMPGEMTTVIVTLRDRADLAAVAGSTRAARLKAVIQALRAEADVSQVGIRALLRVRTAQGKVARSSALWIVNGLSVTATAGVIRELTLFPGVESIASDEVPVVPTAGPPEPNISTVGSPALWSSGFTGQGVVVASLDSGVDLSHPDLAGRWRGGTNSWFDPYGQHTTSPVDLTGHGTGTMGVMVGGDAGGTSIGMAPGAHWIAARIFDDSGKSTATAIHAAFQWLLDPDGNPNTADAPNVVNNSWSYGFGGTCNQAFRPDVQALRAAGIVPVFAAGNFGPGSSTSVSPANYPESLAVGAVNNSDSIYSASSRGPSACGETSTTYPEIVAPGVGIRTAGTYGTYQVLSGTSLSAPHVAGALALLLSAYPNLSASQQVSTLEQGAHDLGVSGPDNTFGFGRLDVLAAYNAASAPDFALVAVPSAVTATAGGSGAATVTLSSLNGFTGDVALSASGVPTSATVSFDPATVAGGTGSSQLTIATSSSLAPGTYPLTITGSSGGLSHTVNVSLVVTAPPDFGLAVTPSSASTVAGGSASYSVSVSALNGFVGDVALSPSGLPVAASAAFSPTTVTGGAGSSQLTVSTSSSLAPGTYPFTITGSSGGLSHTVNVSLVVTAPADFGLVATPSSMTTTVGGNAATTVTVSPVNGFASAVSLSLGGLTSAQATWSFTPGTISGESGSSQLAITTSATLAPGSYPLTITGTSGALIRSTGVTLVVNPAPDFTLGVSPSTITVRRGGQGATTVSVGSIGGFSTPVTLSVSGLPSGVTRTFSSNPVTPGGQSILTLRAGSTARRGTFTITITGSGGGKAHSATAKLTVT